MQIGTSGSMWQGRETIISEKQEVNSQHEAEIGHKNPFW